MERTKEEHKIMNARKIMIEKRKEEQELLLLEQVRGRVRAREGPGCSWQGSVQVAGRMRKSCCSCSRSAVLGVVR